MEHLNKGEGEGEGMGLVFGPEAGKHMVEIGSVFIKRPNPVYMVRMFEAFLVQTNEGVMRGEAGDWLAHDPISGHVWPVADTYKVMHYDPKPKGA